MDSRYFYICTLNLRTVIFLYPWPDAEDDEHSSLPGELFFFDYGVVVMWGLSKNERANVLQVCEKLV